MSIAHAHNLEPKGTLIAIVIITVYHIQPFLYALSSLVYIQIRWHLRAVDDSATYLPSNLDNLLY